VDEYEYQLLMRLAESGDADAKRRIAGYLCEQTEYLSDEQDEALAASYLTELAEAGDVESMVLLGSRYYMGRSGFPQDFGLARQWYERAAEAGDAWALCNLGYIYAYGRGVEVDVDRAFAYFMKSASKENPNAMYKIGDSYFNGEVVPQDFEAAYYWYERAQHAAAYEDENGMPVVVKDTLPSILYRLGGCELKGQGAPFDPMLALVHLQAAEFQLYALIIQEDPFAGETLDKVQALLQETRQKLDELRE